jgi:hypothetical protein
MHFHCFHGINSFYALLLADVRRGVHAPYLIAAVTQSVTLIWRMGSRIEFDFSFDCRFQEAFTN